MKKKLAAKSSVCYYKYMEDEMTKQLPAPAKLPDLKFETALVALWSAQGPEQYNAMAMRMIALEKAEIANDETVVAQACAPTVVGANKR